MDVTARELRELELTESFRGFNRDEVLDLLERAANTIEALEARVRQLTAAATAAPAPTAAVEDDTGRGTEAAARTLALAQRVADETIADAKAEAKGLLERAQADSAQLVAAAEGEVQRIQEVERARIETEISDLERRREALDRSVAELGRSELDYRERLIASIRAELTRIENSAMLAPADRIVAERATDPQATAEFTAADTGATTETGTTDTRSTETGEADLATSPLVGSALEGVTAPPSAPTPTPAATIDLAEEQAAERAASSASDFDDTRNRGDSDDSDDSDDFFASLREATSERTPLSAGEERLFDTDDERDSTFRDVFRRRR